jgi:DNA-binding NarL/FixJ family response regulator
LRREFEFTSVLTFGSIEGARIVLDAQEASVALIGSGCLRNCSFDAMESLATRAGRPIVVFADRTDLSRAAQWIESGAAVLDRRVDRTAFCEAIRQACLGERFCRRVDASSPSERHDFARLEQRSRGLRPRQRDVLSLIATGLRNRDIATTLGLSEATIKAHVQSTFLALGVINRTRAAIFAKRLIEDGLL